MGNEITGRETTVALKKAAAWHTAVACGTSDGLLILTDGLKATIQSEKDDSAGQAWINQADRGELSVTGNLEAYLRYEGFDVMLALLMGIAGAPNQIAATAAYNNTYKAKDSINGLFATMASKKLSNKIWEYPSVKINGFTISGEMNKPVRISFDMVADILERGSSINTTTTMGTVTIPDQKNRVIFNSNTIFRINNQDGDALGSGDTIAPRSFELSFKRPIDTQSVAGSAGIDEPADDGFPEAMLKLNFPRYSTANDAFFDDWNAFTSKKCDITFSGIEIEAGNNYQFKISMPHLKINNPEAAISGAGKIPMSMSADVLGASTAPTGMTSLVEPLQLDIINKRTTDPLG